MLLISKLYCSYIYLFVIFIKISNLTSKFYAQAIFINIRKFILFELITYLKNMNTKIIYILI
jgi:hypothetical protein